MTITSLVDSTVCLIKNPKYPDHGICFNSNKNFMAIAERRDVKDYIGVYSTNDWKLVDHFSVETFDLADMLWMPNDSAIAVWDSQLYYKLLIYCPG